MYDRGADSFPLKVFLYCHLPKFADFRILFCQDTTSEHDVFIECCDKDVMQVTLQVIFTEDQSKGFAQYLISEFDHLMVFGGSVSYDPECHMKIFE
jgi:hypothetical protein